MAAWNIPGGGHNNPSSILPWRIPWTEEPDTVHEVSKSWIRLKRFSIHTHTQHGILFQNRDAMSGETASRIKIECV